jgi:hypothetical protein
MPAPQTRADSIREYLTGGNSDGAAQYSPSLSLGNYRSAAEAISLGILMDGMLPSAKVLFASGANPVGSGVLTAVDANHLTWTPNRASASGPSSFFPVGTTTQLVEALNAPGQFLRVLGTPPFSQGACSVVLNYLVNNVFGFDDVVIANAAAGISCYRATILRNESSGTVSAFSRYLATYGTQQVSDVGQLGGSGAGTITTSGSFATWPKFGWCQVRNSGGTLKEAVYYSARTLTALTVPAAGRGLLGTSATAGASTDKLYAAPGIAIALEPGGVQASGSSIQTIASATTAPSGVTWNLEITAGAGLQLGSFLLGQQIGIWMWRHIPAGAKATPLALNETLSGFTAE